MRAKDYNVILPRNILKVINEKGLKQGAVAKKAGYSKQQLSAMLNGRKIIKPCDVLAISDALEISVGTLFETDK